ncbi:MAG: hypothetical protein JXR37_09130 [Kiritimatiellae bacterium]|nr:hypothetical protein [Kiritimatiellia bacterium]
MAADNTSQRTPPIDPAAEAMAQLNTTISLLKITLRAFETTRANLERHSLFAGPRRESTDAPEVKRS